MSLSAFLKQNKKERANVKYVASESFVDENGKPVEWEIRAIKSKEADAIRQECTVFKKGKQQSFDSSKFTIKLAVAGTVFPNLNSTELQESYGVVGAEELLYAMLDNDGEYQKYCAKIMDISGYNTSQDELEEEVKNS